MALHSIMIVDDNEDMLVIYSRVLIQEGFEVFTASFSMEVDVIRFIPPPFYLTLYR